MQATALRRSNALGPDRARYFLVRVPAWFALCKAATSNLRENKRCNLRIGYNIRLIFKNSCDSVGRLGSQISAPEGLTQK